MQRIRMSALTLVEDHYYIDYGELFTGIAFEIIEGLITQKYNFVEGRIDGTYNPPYFTSEDSEVWVDQAILVSKNDNDYQPYLYKGHLFTGTACSFDGIFCESELQFQNGYEGNEVEFFPSGELELIRSCSPSLFQEHQWHPNGTFSSVILGDRNSCKVTLEFNKNQDLTNLTIHEDYFARISKFKNELRYDVFSDPHFSKNITINKKLSISADGISDSIFAELQNCAGFDALEDLTFFYVALSPKVFAGLAKLRHLKKLYIKDRRPEILPLVTQLKLERPLCSIFLNDKEIS